MYIGVVGWRGSGSITFWDVGFIYLKYVGGWENRVQKHGEVGETISRREGNGLTNLVR